MTLNARCHRCLIEFHLHLCDEIDEWGANVIARFALCPACQPHRTEAGRDVAPPIEIVEPRHARLPYLDS